MLRPSNGTFQDATEGTGGEVAYILRQQSRNIILLPTRYSNSLRSFVGISILLRGQKEYRSGESRVYSVAMQDRFGLPLVNDLGFLRKDLLRRPGDESRGPPDVRIVVDRGDEFISIRNSG
jgi:hypothetical protein